MIGFRLQLALHCECVTCGRNVGNKAQDDAAEALIFGLGDVYALCPSCLQKPLGGGRDEEYRRRARVVLFERYGIVVRDGRAVAARTACPECGSEVQRTRMGVAPAGSHESEARETDVLACTGCEHVEEEME